MTTPVLRTATTKKVTLIMTKLQPALRYLLALPCAALRGATLRYAAPLSVVVRASASLLMTSLIIFLLSLVLAKPTYAAGSNMPWEGPLQSILDSLQGPVARIVAVIIIIMTGLTLAFGDTSGGFRKLIQIVFGLSIAFAASSYFLNFFSFGGGALIATA